MEWRQQKRCLILQSRCPPIITGIQVYSRGLSLAENSETINTASVHTIPSQSPLLSCVYQYHVDCRLCPGQGISGLRADQNHEGISRSHPLAVWFGRYTSGVQKSECSAGRPFDCEAGSPRPRSKPTLFQSLRGSRLFQHSQDGVFYFFHTKYSRLDVVSRPLNYLNVLLWPTVQSFGFRGPFFNSETLFWSIWCARLWGQRTKEAVLALRISWACG